MEAITEEIVKSFEMHLHEAERSGNTVKKYLRDVRAFRTWLGGRPLEKGIVLLYKRELCARYAPRSVNSVLSSLNALFSYAQRYECRVKMLKMQRRIFADKERELTRAEYGRLLDAAGTKGNERLYFLMQTIASTGVRISELQYVTAEAVRRGQAEISCKGKLRVVFLPKQLCKMLKGYLAKQKIESGPVFRTGSGKPLDRSTVWKMLKGLCESAGVARAKVFPHNFRHLFARTFYSMQKDIVRLADILGHSSIETTRLYTIESGEVHRKLLQKLGLLRI